MIVPEQTPDLQLIQAARTGGAEALSEVYRRHAKMVYRVALRFTASHADAEDILQDVFVGLPEALRRFEARGSFDAWLRRIAVRTTLSRIRARGRRREVALEDAAEPAGPPAQERLLDRTAIEHAVAQLPEPLRLVFVLREGEGYSHNEIGEMLGIRSGTSEVRLHRAKRLLRKLLGSE